MHRQKNLHLLHSQAYELQIFTNICISNPCIISFVALGIWVNGIILQLTSFLLSQTIQY